MCAVRVSISLSARAAHVTISVYGHCAAHVTISLCAQLISIFHVCMYVYCLYVVPEHKVKVSGFIAALLYDSLPQVIA